MKSLFLTACLIFLTTMPSFAQPEVEWERTYGGEGPHFGEGLVVSPQGGYAIGGYVGEQIWLGRIQADGEMTWDQTYDLEGQSNACLDLCNTNNNGFLLVGRIRADNAYGWYAMRVDAEGNEVWRRVYHQGGHSSVLNYAWAVQPVQSDHFIIAGYVNEDGENSDGLAMLIDGDGDVIWETQVGTEDYEGFTDVVIAPDGFALCGIQSAQGNRDAWLVKLNPEGGVEWQIRYGVENLREEAWGLTLTQDDGYGLLCWQTADNEAYDNFIVHTNSAGEVLWQHLYEQEGRELGYAILQNADQGFSFTGQRSAGQRFYIGYAQNTDRDGNPTWDMAYGEPFLFSDSKAIVYDPAERAVLVCGTTYVGNNEGIMDASLAKLTIVNHPPQIIRHTPSDSIIVLLAGDDSLFTADAVDIDNDPITQWWTLDGDSVAGESMYLYTANDPGLHRLAFYVSDGEYMDSTAWDVHVFEIIASFEPLQTRFDGPVDTSVFFSMTPGVPLDSLVVTWYHNEEVIGNDTSFTIYFTSAGEQRLEVEAEWMGRKDSVAWVVDIFAPDTTKPDTSESVSEELLPQSAALLEVHPNPFNSSTTISYSLPKAGWTTLDIVDINGRLVQRLSDGWKEAGSYREAWNPPISAGMYYLNLRSREATVETMPLIILR